MRIPSRFRLASAVLAVLGAAVLGLHTPSASAAGTIGGAGTHAAAAALTSPQPVAARTMAETVAASGGLCSVPGIGDIGGLLGFCSLGSSGVIGAVNNLCQPSLPQPEQASTGINSLIRPPSGGGKQLATPYNEYGISGQFWAATNLQCSDMTSLIGNDVAGMLFDFAKAIDRLTITVYQAAASEGILSWLQNTTDQLVGGLGKAIYFPYLALVVILGALWLAWQGLIRKRGTLTLEGTIWMVIACAAAIWLIGRPADFTGLGKGVSDGISVSLDAAFASLPSPGQASCLPVTTGDPQINPASFSYTSGRTVVDQNANELWTVLVCKPWLDGEFGTTAFAAPGGKPTPVNLYGRQLLWAQAIAVNEQPTAKLIQAKQAAYAGIAQSIQQNDPAIYPLFQGKEWTTRLEIGFAALLAALVAGVLVLLISVTLILLKLGFLLLLIAGPFFLLIGTHPGFGRVIAVRWFEMLVGVLLKQAAVALALSVLLYSYALIMGTADSVLPWALKILMITLVTVAVFIYRKPFQHLFAAVGYGAIGSTDRAEADLSRAAATAAANTRAAATLAVPGFAAYRAARWARRNPAQAASLAMGAASTTAVTSSLAGAADGGMGGETAELAGTGGSGAVPVNLAGGSSGSAFGRARAWGSSAGSASAGQAPPLRLPRRTGEVPVSWIGNGAGATGNGTGPGTGRVAPPRPRQPGGSAPSRSSRPQVPVRRPVTGAAPVSDRRPDASGARMGGDGSAGGGERPGRGGGWLGGSGRAGRAAGGERPGRGGGWLGGSGRPGRAGGGERPGRGEDSGSGQGTPPRSGRAGQSARPARSSGGRRPPQSERRGGGRTRYGQAATPGPSKGSRGPSGEEGAPGLPLNGPAGLSGSNRGGPFWLRPTQREK